MPRTLERDLEVRSISIANFRCIKSAKLNFDSNITLLIGKNGSGKTSILDAIVVGLQSFQDAWEYRTGPKSPIRRSRVEASEIFQESKFFAIDLILNTSHQNLLGPQSVRIRSHTDKSIANESFSAILNHINEFSHRFHKPLFVYYGQERGFEGGRASRKAALSEDSLDGNLKAISDLGEWWDQRDAEEARTVRDTGKRDFRDPQLEAIRSLVKRIEGFRDIFYSSSFRPQGLYFRKEDGAAVHVSKLSSGERSYVILLADLARRLQLTSPDRDISEIPGIVLIDEIELNLHPSWQSEIVSTMREVFPACQFIITTHSPQVLSAVPSLNVRIVKRSPDGEVLIDAPLSTRGRSSNYLLEGVFGAFERLPEVDQMIEEFNDAIDSMDYAQASNILDRIKMSVEGNPPEILVLNKRLKNLKSAK
jgi:predicted ATP-binding protein involved in virulence